MALEGWDNFYVIVGSSAGALIGLQFVVITLLADAPAELSDAKASRAFATPSVIHFGAVLLLSALVSAPWHEVGTAANLCGLAGLAGVLFSLLVARRMRTQTAYRPVLEDWVCHALLPLAAYAALAAAAWVARGDVRTASFLIGAAALLLLFVGIHNAWDAATFHVFVRRRQHKDGGGHGG